MATKVYKFYGECRWAKVHTPDEKYDTYQLDLFMDKPSWALYEKSERQLKVKEAEEGKFVTFRRPDAKLIKKELVKFGPPKVVDGVGRPIEDLVGNGSKVAIEVAVYDTQKGKGHRMEKVTVLELVPFGGRVEDAHEGTEVEEDTPDVKPKKVVKNAVIDDEIPF